MSAIDITLTPFGPTHLPGALALSQQAGWPHRLEDWRFSLALSTGVVALDAGGRVLGTALTTCHDETLATVNMVIVDAAVRGRGLGRQLMEAAMAAAGTQRLRLVATAEGLPLYEKLGFRATGEIAQHQGVVTALHGAAPADRPDLDAVAAMDAAAYGARRPALIAALAAAGRVFTQPGGFAVRRPFGRGEVIGPVVARDAAIARTLVAAAAAGPAGRFLRVDTPLEQGLGPWLADLGLTQAGGGIAMQRGPDTPGKSAFTTFALANQALG